MSLDQTISQLESQKATIQDQINKLDQAIQVLQSLGGGAVTAPVAGTLKGRKLSPAVKAKMRAAQQARWAKIKGTAPAQAAKPVKVKKGPVISAAGIAKIRAAQKARWAKINAEKAAAAAKPEEKK